MIAPESTQEQFVALWEMVCDRFQGDLFSRPVPAAQAAQLIPEPRSPSTSPSP